jgi:hypothetical protein
MEVGFIWQNSVGSVNPKELYIRATSIRLRILMHHLLENEFENMNFDSTGLLETDLSDFKSLLLPAVAKAFDVDKGIPNKDPRKIWRIESEADSLGSGTMFQEEENWRDFRTQIELRRTLEVLPETIELSNFISKRFSGLVIKILASNHEFPLHDGAGLLFYFCIYRQKNGGLSAEDIVSKLIEELQMLSKQKNLIGRFEFFAPIAGLDLPVGVNEIQLSSKIKIVRLSRTEREEVAYHHNHISFSADPSGPLKCRVAFIYQLEKVLVLNCETSPIEGVAQTENPQGALEATLQTLHLLFDGSPTVLFTEQRSVDTIFDFNFGKHSPNSGRPFLVPMQIDAVQIDRLKKTHSSILANQNSQIKLALSRLAQSTSRSDQSDQLIDSVIALESLLTPSEELGEMTFRIGVYFALIGRKSEFKRRKQQIAQIFRTRGRIVHGGNSQPETLAEDSKLAANFAREVILWCLEHPKLPNQTKIENTFWQDYLFEHFHPPPLHPHLDPNPVRI